MKKKKKGVASPGGEVGGAQGGPGKGKERPKQRMLTGATGRKTKGGGVKNEGRGAGKKGVRAGDTRLKHQK